MTRRPQKDNAHLQVFFQLHQAKNFEVSYMLVTAATTAVTSIRLKIMKIRNLWYTSKSCKVQKLGPWVL